MESGDRGRAERDRHDSQTSPASIVMLDHSDACSYRGKHGLKIETLALPGEDPAELRALLDQWYDAYQPVSPAECHLVDMAVYDLIRIRRCRRCQESVEEKLIRDTRNRWSIEQEGELKKFRAMLATATGRRRGGAQAVRLRLRLADRLLGAAQVAHGKGRRNVGRRRRGTHGRSGWTTQTIRSSAPKRPITSRGSTACWRKATRKNATSWRSTASGVCFPRGASSRPAAVFRRAGSAAGVSVR